MFKVLPSSRLLQILFHTFLLSLFIVSSFVYVLDIWDPCPPPPNHSWIVSTQLFEKSPGVWNATLIFCGSSLCRCLSALSANYRWWLVVWGGCAEVLLELSARRETLLKRVKEQALWFSPPRTALWFDLMKTGWACFRDIFQPSCPMMVGVHLCLLLLWIICPATFLNICHTHPSSLSPSSALGICSLQAFTMIAYFLRTCLNVCFSYLLLPDKSVQS